MARARCVDKTQPFAAADDGELPPSAVERSAFHARVQRQPPLVGRIAAVSLALGCTTICCTSNAKAAPPSGVTDRICTAFLGIVIDQGEGLSKRNNRSCWTYSHHCQIADMKPSKESYGTENFGGFVYVLDGFPQRDFVLWVFMCPTNVTLFCVFYYVSIFSLFPATTPRATTPHPYHHGLSRLCIHPGYHAIVYSYSLVITPEISRSTTLVHWVITPAIVVRIL